MVRRKRVRDPGDSSLHQSLTLTYVVPSGGISENYSASVRIVSFCVILTDGHPNRLPSRYQPIKMMLKAATLCAMLS